MPASNTSPWLRAVPFLFVLLWSTGFIGAKFGLPYADPLTFLSVRFALVSVLMAALAWWVAAPWPRGWRAWWHLGIAGLLIHGAYLGGVFTAIDYGLPAGIASLLVGMQPLLTALLAGWLVHEPVSQRQWLGTCLGLLGLCLVVGLRSDVNQAQNLKLTQLFPAVLALFGITLGTLYQRRFCPRFDLRTGSVAQFIPTCIVSAAIVSLWGNWAITWSGEFMFALSWLVLVLSIGAVSLLGVLIRSQSAVGVSSLFYLTPAVTALMAWLLFNEQLNAWQLLGMGIAISGVWLARAKPPSSKQ